MYNLCTLKNFDQSTCHMWQLKNDWPEKVLYLWNHEVKWTKSLPFRWYMSRCIKADSPISTNQRALLRKKPYNQINMPNVIGSLSWVNEKRFIGYNTFNNIANLQWILSMPTHFGHTGVILQSANRVPVSFYLLYKKKIPYWIYPLLYINNTHMTSVISHSHF